MFFNKQEKIFSIIKTGTTDELLAHLEAFPDSVNLNSSSARSYSKPLTWAAYFNKPEALKILIEHGADIMATNTQGHDAYYYARSKGFTNCINILEPLVQKLSEPKQKKPEGFVKEGDSKVSIIESAPHCGVTETTIYDFNKATVSIARSDCPQPLVQSFHDAASKKQLYEAADFLRKNDGDVCGFVVPTVK